MNIEQLETIIQLNQDLAILYIEDSEIVRESTYSMMEEFFTHIDVAEDGVQGLAQYKSYYSQHGKYYDIVFTDINMPKMNGIEMSQLILEENFHQHIAVISAHNESSYLLKLINMGISNFILKPINITQFQAVLSRLIHAISNEKLADQQHKELLEVNLLLELATKKADQDSRMKSQFLANMSHEIRTPLNAITGFISLLHAKETDAEKIKYLEVIQNSSDSLLQIISDILDISKIESGKLDIVPVDFNPYSDLITVAELFQEKATAKGVILNIKYNHTMPQILYGDSLRIKQILSNLLSNAVKFTPQGSVVKCIVWYKNGCLKIKVKDYGIGIPKEKQKDIFKSFTQAESSTVREYGGTGLGLTISLKLTKMLKGTLTLNSQENKGTIFLLSLPIRIGREIPRNLPKKATETFPSKGHVLLVDDTETNLMFIGIVLDGVGITYETANNGLDAIEKWKNGNYDLILMDENMPKLNGTGATKEIIKIEKEKNLKHTPIISLTANALKGDREIFLKAGMDDYISKPVNPPTLLSILEKYLSHT